MHSPIENAIRKLSDVLDPGHRHHHCSREKNYNALPLGGNRPIAAVASLPPAEEKRHRRIRRRHRDEMISRGDHEASSTMERSGSDDSGTSHGSQRSTTSYHGSAMGIIINQSQPIPRTSIDGTESKTPLITATPPTPTPEEFIRRQREDLNHRNKQIRLDRRRRSNTNPDHHHMEPRSITHSENVKRHSQPVGDELPPYPVTPPGSEVNISTDYMTHTRRQRAATAPPVPLFNPPIIDRRESKGFRPPAVELPAREVRSSGHKGYEELYHTLRTFSTIFLIDDSPSMIHHWSSTRVAFENLATTALQYITDGVEVAFLNDYIAERNITRVYTKEDVRKCFEDTVLKGVTPIGDALDGVLKEYIDGYVEVKAAWSSPRLLSGDRFGNEGPTTTTTNHTRKRPKPLNIVILTDGIPTDDVESVIVSNARLLDSLNAPLSQVGIQFVQIGNEEGVREELKDLDDYIANVYGIRDMVDTTPYVEGDMGEGDWLQKALLGGVNRRVDKMG